MRIDALLFFRASSESPMNTRVQCFQHVSFEGLGNIEPLLSDRACQLSTTRWYAGEEAPDSDSYDLLIVMGGPMGIYDYDKHSWLHAEKDAIKSAIDAGKKVLGICLGAQLIADVLGAKVSKNPCREIGWFPVRCNPALQDTVLVNVFPDSFEPLHWHGDTFSLPKDAIALGASEACEQQGFVFDNRVVGLQFHLELNVDGIATLSEACRDELDGSAFVQSPAQMLAARDHFKAAQNTLVKLIDAFL